MVGKHCAMFQSTTSDMKRMNSKIIATWNVEIFRFRFKPQAQTFLSRFKKFKQMIWCSNYCTY